MRIAPIIVLAMLSSSCGRNDETIRNQPTGTANATGTVAQVAALSDRQRNAVFIRAIRDAGLECQHVDWSTPSGTYRGMSVWTAACARNQVWTIVVGDDGVAQVLNPAEGLWLDNRLDSNRQ